MQRLIFHVDVNSAFLSWEAARRVAAGKPDLRLVPAAIGGDRDKRTGIILAKSIPAKQYGVTTGEPVAMALRKCPELIIVKPDFRLYEKCSRAFMDICRAYTPVTEKYSIDEIFLDMTGTERLYADYFSAAAEIKNRIRDELGFTVNIGIGPNKILAKMAGELEKPDKIHTIFAADIERKMWPLPVGELFSVGKASADKLNGVGIKTVGDLAKADEKKICRLLGGKFGRQLIAYARGIDDSPVAAAERSKGYSISVTSEDDITDMYQAEKVLLALADSVAARMRADGAKAGGLAVSLRGSDFADRSHQGRFIRATDVTSEIFAKAAALLSELWDARTPLRLLGISLINLSFNEGEQVSMFTDERNEQARLADKTVDELRRRYGSQAVVRGGVFLSGLEVGKKYRAQMENKAADILADEKRNAKNKK